MRILVIVLFVTGVAAKYSSGKQDAVSLTHTMDCDTVNLFYQIGSNVALNIYVMDSRNKRLYDERKSFEYDMTLSSLGVLFAAMGIVEYDPKYCPGYVQIETMNGNISTIDYVIVDSDAKNCRFVELIIFGIALSMFTLISGLIVGRISKRTFRVTEDETLRLVPNIVS